MKQIGLVNTDPNFCFIFQLDILPWDEEEVDFDVEQFRESDYYSVVEHFGQKKVELTAIILHRT